MSPRRFSLVPLLFFVLWVLWFLLPPTRQAARSQWTARFVPSPTFAPFGEPSDDSASDSSRDAAFVHALTQNGSVSKQGNARRSALEALGRRFPNDAAICAAQIVASTTELRLGLTRQPGPSSNTDLNWSVKLAKLEPPSPEVLKSWFAATERGAKLEPNNTFWDWAKIIGLLAARRDDEVWTVLRAARGKTAYDDHVNEGALARLRETRRERGLTSPMIQISISAATLFPHFGRMREAARQVSDNASGLRLSGEPLKQKQALEGMRDFVLLSRTMRRESKTLIGSLVGQAMESIGLWGGSYSPNRPGRRGRPVPGSALAKYANDPRSLLFFARATKRTEIAAQLSHDWNELGTWRRKTTTLAGMSFLLGIEPRDFVLAQAGDWLGSLLLAGLPTLLVWALACSASLRFVPSWRREGGVFLSPASWAWGAILSVISVLVLSSIAFWALGSAWGRSTAGSALIDMLLAPIYGTQGGASIVPFAWQYHFPALLGGLTALWFAGVWSARREGKPTLGARLRGIFGAPDDGLTRFDLSPLLSLAGVIFAGCLLTTGVLGFLILPTVNEDFSSLHDYAGLVLASFALLLGVPALLRVKGPQGRAFGLALARRFAWGQILFVTLVWGALWMIAEPAQHRFEVGLTRQLQVGEFQIARKQLGI